MKTLQTIYHKKNEIQEVQFFKDKECTEDFYFTGAKNIYINLKDGDSTPLTALCDNNIYIDTNYYVPYCPHLYTLTKFRRIKTLDDITPNLSKYIPEDNAVLFLSEEDLIENRDKTYPREHLYMQGDILQYLTVGSEDCKKITIFLSHGTQSEIQKAEEVAKHLWKNFGIKPNLYVLHWFFNYDGHIESDNTFCKGLSDTALEEDVCCTSAIRSLDDYEECLYINNINKIITTNSTGILKPEDSTERLQVIDAKEVFEDSLKTQR